jgi:hypothetical protein
MCRRGFSGFCQCVYNPSGYPQSCAIHRTMALPTQQYLMQQPTALYADSPGPSYLHPAPPSMLNAMRIPPPPAARAVPAVNRNQHKRQLHESISVTSSSDDDDINVAGGRGDSLAAGTRTPLRSRSSPSVPGSSKGPRKSLRIHSPPKSAELGVAGGRSTDTIDLAASSDDDEVIEPGLFPLIVPIFIPVVNKVRFINLCMRLYCFINITRTIVQNPC